MPCVYKVIRNFSLAQPNIIHAKLLFFSCWLVVHIKIYYINTIRKFYFFNVGLEAYIYIYIYKENYVFSMWDKKFFCLNTQLKMRR